MPPRDNGHEHGEPVIRDNRKIDPETGLPRVRPEAGGDSQAPTDQAPAPERAGSVADGELEAQLAERTADLQRLQAEYTNYRRRVERDRVAVREQAVAGALMELLPVLDDIGRARDHGELTGGFAKVAESLEAAVTKLGLAPFGQKGDPFDPTVHEALMHSYSPDVTEPTAIEVLQPGYRMGDRVLRPARVAVAEPEDAPPASDSAADGD
ncbi:nucleotide exchange factor GrpE [Nonomuraea rhodomycinica]|uniref:Protein GrpE n=1 Tax=Nonomuraea rhodomycinica TaxID=1712872 RepID=A0A7Y6IV98_9ACTN|nr:nucleotide exchange factor GrpE [Nonomuraea rhodomycinica]NUW44790.1 nucleotide exchange factor GrpE [Nonomuraea rhodomycinica]